MRSLSLIALVGCSPSFDDVAAPDPVGPEHPAPGVEDRAPEAAIDLPTSEDVHYVDVPLWFSGQVHDPEGRALTAWWESDRDGPLPVDALPDAEGFVVGRATLSEGDHTITLHVDDGHGQAVATVEQVRVGPPNEAPDGEWISPPGQVYAADDVVTLRASVGDVDVPAEWLRVEVWSSLDGWIGTTTPSADGRVRFEAADLSLGDHQIRMVVSDEIGAFTTLATDVRVAAAPEVVIVAPIDHSAFPESRTIVLVTMTQDDDSSVPDTTVAWTSQRDGKLGEAQPDKKGYAEVRAEKLSAGEHLLTVTVTDHDGLQAQQQIAITVE